MGLRRLHLVAYSNFGRRLCKRSRRSKLLQAHTQAGGAGLHLTPWLLVQTASGGVGGGGISCVWIERVGNGAAKLRHEADGDALNVYSIAYRNCSGNGLKKNCSITRPVAGLLVGAS
jgi:hypothetical protein